MKLLFFALLASFAAGFAPVYQPTNARLLTTLKAKKSDDNTRVAASFMAAAYLLANAATVAPAFAFSAEDNAFDTGSSQVIAARSGGRMGGRVSRGGYGGGGGYSRGGGGGGYNRSYRSSTTIVRPMIAPSPVIVSPGFGYGYNPFGGFGMGYGLGAMQNLGNEARDYRQESEIQQDRAELEQAKKREAELEQRIKALEEQSSDKAETKK